MHELLHRQPALSPGVVLVLAIIVFSFLSDKFLKAGNFGLILQQMAFIGALAVGQTLIILTAGVDLSIGAVMVLSSLVMAKLDHSDGVPGVLALLVGIDRRRGGLDHQRHPGHPDQAAPVHRHAWAR